ncbi:extracellular protein, partial [Lasiosphaeria miniovina]
TMKTTCYASFAVALASVASAHMEMSYPPPLKSKFNPSSGSNVDYSMTSPLHADGSDYPCKGYLSLLGTPTGAPVASWTAGESHNMTIVGGAVHGGGSCQASVSVDGGKTFRVVHSYVGGCPSGASSSFAFQLPADVPASKAGIFAWTWNNNLGNREMYMNCAIVDIAGGSGGSSGVAFDSRPAVFVADVGNGCTTLDSANVLYPDPGPDVTGDTSTAKPPIGASCGTVVAAP